jgi:cysteine desulfurase / selenocysteine lyase
MTLYLDNAASSHPKPEIVYQTVNEVLRNIGANPGRAGHRLALMAARHIIRTRQLLAELFDIPHPERIAFTANATEAINKGLKGLLNPGDQVITSSMEHNSLIRPLRQLESQGIELALVSANERGEIRAQDFEKAIGKKGRLMVLTHASNVTGGIMPIAEIAEVAHRHGLLFMVDAAQTAGLVPLSVAKTGIDLLAVPGHKGLMGPQGTGFLYAGPEVTLRTLVEGGTGSQSELEVQPEFWPDCMESGTLNTPGIAGLGAGVSFILGQGLTEIRKKEMTLGRQIGEGLSHIPSVRTYGPEASESRTAVVSFNVREVNPQTVASVLDMAYDIAVRPGLHCAVLAHRTLGTFPEGTVRVSPGFFTREEDIEIFLRAIAEIAKQRSK